MFFQHNKVLTSIDNQQKDDTDNQNLFFLFEETLPRKTHFMGPGELVKHPLSKALTRGTHPDSNSRPAMQISSPLPSHYVSRVQ
jgi:hypothetical protein